MTSGLLCGLTTILIAGCPQTGGDTGVNAVIGYATSSGDAPFNLIASGASSTSRNGAIVAYLWDFGDGRTATESDVVHTYANPGRYLVRLTVTDSAGREGVTALEVRVRGGAVVAVISADQDSGASPLRIQFDATNSVATDDVIRDYIWDFGDGETSNEATVAHTFVGSGEFTVTLRVISSGGVEATTSMTVTVGERRGSLLFDGSSFATLPLGAPQSLEEFTLEAWVRSEAEGGTLMSFGTGLSVELVPATSTVRLRIQGTPTEFPSAGLTANWKHVAVTYGDTSGGGSPLCVVYVDGALLGSTATVGALSADRVTLGNGLRGKAGEVRCWSVVRTQDEISTWRSTRMSGGRTGLLGIWPLNDGSDQTLRNVGGVTDGTRGSSADVETSDPAWDSGQPPV